MILRRFLAAKAAARKPRYAAACPSAAAAGNRISS